MALLIVLFCVIVAFFYFGIKGIEAAEAEYLADPEAWEERNPERREMF